MFLELTADIVPAEAMTAAAQFLNTFFAQFDYKILEFYHMLHESVLGGFFDVFFKYFTLLGDGGIFLICLSLILLLFKKTRKVGCGMLGGIVIGAVFTNLTIKPIIARPRPYMTNETFQSWWAAVGHGLEGEVESFPSGHTTSAMAAAMPVFLMCKKNVSWLVFLFVILMGASRNYIVVHFPSDILGGIIIGGLAGIISYLLVRYLYDKIIKPESKLANFDIVNSFKKNK